MEQIELFSGFNEKKPKDTVREKKTVKDKNPKENEFNNKKHETEKTIYFIDGSAFIHRAFHAIRGLATSKGMPSNAIFGYTRMLLKLIEDRKPKYIGVFFDVKGPTFRHEMYKDYKANRPPMADELVVQIPYVKDVTRGLNIQIIEKVGFEADDLIGTLASKAEADGFTVVMVTGDKDFMQLVTQKTSIWDPMKEKITDETTVIKELGITPGQVIDMMGFSGDMADNIPGVPGIGPKTAVSLIKEFGSMESVYEKINTIKKKKQKENLVNFKEQAFLSRKLVTIDTNVSLSFDPNNFLIKKPNKKFLSNLFKELEFNKLQREFQQKPKPINKKYIGITDEKALILLIEKLNKAEFFAVDTETTSKNPMNASLVGLSFSIKENEGYYIPCKHKYLDVPEQISRQKVLDLLRPLLENPEIKKIGQNIKYDEIVLSRHGVNLAGVVFDTMIASYLVNPTRRGHSLDQLALDLLGHKTISFEDVIGKGKKALKSFAEVPLEKAVPYAAEDADITLAIYNILFPMIEKKGLNKLFLDVEMPLVSVLKEMEMEGISIDSEKLLELSKTFAHELSLIEEKIYSLAGETFNIKSSQQLGHILFEKLGLPVQKKTKKKTGYSTDVDVLTKLSEKHELPVLILRYRSLAKLKSTYTDALTEMIHPETKRIHTSFNQIGTITGRLSSSEPNLQNIPIRTDEGREIRSAFIPRTDWLLLAADYSQIELRILAHCANDKILIDAFNQDEDIHTRTASEVFQVLPNFITPELRQQAKAINFGIIYGMSAFGLAKELGISRKMAQTYINNYFARYSGVKEFIDKTIIDARTNLYTSTLLGRVRNLSDITSPRKNIREFAERVAINTPIQGTAADLIKLAMIKVNNVLKEEKLQAKMLLSVHDEIVFEVPHKEEDILTSLVKEVMEGIWNLKVPLKVNISSGKNWVEAH